MRRFDSTDIRLAGLLLMLGILHLCDGIADYMDARREEQEDADDVLAEIEEQTSFLVGEWGGTGDVLNPDNELEELAIFAEADKRFKRPCKGCAEAIAAGKPSPCKCKEGGKTE